MPHDRRNNCQHETEEVAIRQRTMDERAEYLENKLLGFIADNAQRRRDARDATKPPPYAGIRWEVMTRQTYHGSERVGCPRCGVCAPEPCFGQFPMRAHNPHVERVTAARELGYYAGPDRRAPQVVNLTPETP